MDSDEFEKLVRSKLEGKSREQCAAFALRIAFRMLPLMAHDTQRINADKEAFWFWNEKDRRKHLLFAGQTRLKIFAKAFA